MSIDDSSAQSQNATRTAGEAGWHVSRYNLAAKVPGTKMTAIANLIKGNCGEYTPIECYLLSVLEELDEHHPIIERFAKRGIICNFDERAALETMGRAACATSRCIGLTICPTMACNFDCPYCFEDHTAGKMTQDIQDDVVALAKRMLDAAGTDNLCVSWFGGEPLLAPGIIESLSKRLMSLVEERGGDYSAYAITNGYLLTQDVADMLGSCKVKSIQVTIDGLGATHDATRHLACGGPTFDRIVSNLRDNKLPFRVNVRHNVHEGNLCDVDKLNDFISRIAEESGNDIMYYPADVDASDAADRRGNQVDLLCDASASEIGIRREAYRFHPGYGHYCVAHNFWNIGIDDRGNLQKCWEAIDKPYIAFGTAHDWDPTNPFATASNPNNMTKYLNSANPLRDEECHDCVWLPTCAGGCPHKRLFSERQCVPFKDDAESYVLALHARIGENKNDAKEQA